MVERGIYGKKHTPSFSKTWGGYQTAARHQLRHCLLFWPKKKRPCCCVSQLVACAAFVWNSLTRFVVGSFS